MDTAISPGPLRLHEEDELALLLLLVEEVEGSLLAFALYRSIAEQEAVARALRERLPMPVVSFTLSETERNPVPLLESVPDGTRACVQFFDVEAALPDAAGFLNHQREAFAAVPHAVLFWVGEHGLREIAHHAPDFWAWRSGVFDFRTDEATARSMERAIAAAPFPFSDRADLDRRIRLYRRLLEGRDGSEVDPAFVSSLLRRLTEAYLYLWDLPQADVYARQLMHQAEQNDEDALPAACFYLGIVAQERRAFEEAEVRYREALAVFERLGDERNAALTYHQLGIVAQERRAFEEAEVRYREALAVFERLGDERNAAITYHNLGSVAEERRAFEEAEVRYQRSLAIKERLGDEHGTASTYHQLGSVAQERRAFGEAEAWYREALAVFERLGDERGAASTYHNLGRVAQERRDFEEAERWYHRSLEVRERLGDEHGAASTYGQLGALAKLRERYVEAGRWLVRCILTFAQVNDPHNAQRGVQNFLIVLRSAPLEDQAQLRAMWSEAGLPDLPEYSDAE